jgi:hypothetical protein
VEILDSRRLGGAWTLERLGIGAAMQRAAAGRRLDGRAPSGWCSPCSPSALEPGSKLAATRWVAERVAIDGLGGFSDDQAYRAMDFLLDALDEIAAEIFNSVAHLLNLDLDIVFVDTSSTYWETDCAGTDPELADEPGDDETHNPAERPGRGSSALQGSPARSAAGGDRDGGHPGRGAGAVLDLPRGHRGHRGHPHREGRPGQLGVASAGVGGRPGFASAANRGYLTRGGGHYIHAEKLRNTNTEAAAALARAGRYRTIADNLRVKEVHVAPGGNGDGDCDGERGARAQRFVPQPGGRRAGPAGPGQPHRPPDPVDRRLRRLDRPPRRPGAPSSRSPSNWSPGCRPSP